MCALKQEALLPGIKLKEKRKEQSFIEEGASAQSKTDWPPMAEMLHSVLIFEPAAQQPTPGQDRSPASEVQNHAHGEHKAASDAMLHGLQLACTRLGLSWRNMLCLSLHGKNNFVALNSAVGRGVALCVQTDGVIRPDGVARHLLDRGVDWFFAHIFEDLNLPEEAAAHVSLDQAAAMNFGPSCTMVLTPSAAPRRPRLGLEDGELAVEGGLVTKMPVRATALALLRIAPWHTVWDIGSGSGAVAMEAAALAHQGRVIAVEKRPERILCIEENRRRFGVAQVDIHLGEVPDCLEPLPNPHRVFLGGGVSGQDGLQVLDQISSRLLGRGRVVVNCALLGTLERCRGFFNERGWPCEVICVQAAKAKPLADDVRLAAMEPIFLLTAQKPEEIS